MLALRALRPTLSLRHVAVSPLRRLCTSGEQKPPPDDQEDEGHEINFILPPPPNTLCILCGVSAGVVFPLSWGVSAACAASAVTAPLLNVGGQISWNVYQQRLLAQEHAKLTEPPRTSSFGFGFVPAQVFASLVIAVVAVLVRYAADPSSANAGQPPLLEFMAGKSDVRALERRIDEQQEQLSEMREEVAALRRELRGER